MFGKPDDSQAIIHREELTAQIKTLSVSGAIDKAYIEHLATNAALEMVTERTLDRLIITLSKRILAGDTVEENRPVKYPAGWWQHLKFDLYYNMPEWVRLWSFQFHIGQWLEKNWPVQFTTVDVPCRITRMCPHIEIPNHHHTCFRWLFPVQTARLHQP